MHKFRPVLRMRYWGEENGRFQITFYVLKISNLKL